MDQNPIALGTGQIQNKELPISVAAFVSSAFVAVLNFLHAA